MTEGLALRPYGDDVGVATLFGEVDLANAAVIGSELTDALAASAVGLVLDLRALAFIDSSGIRMLFALAGRAETTRQTVGIVADEASPTWRLLKITNIHEIVTICSNVDECVEGMRQRGS